MATLPGYSTVELPSYMSVREVKQLREAQLSSRLRSGRIRTMSDANEAPTVEDLMSQVDRLSSQLLDKDRELERLADEATQQLEQSRKTAEERISHLERELEQAEMRGELATLRALEKLRVEHSQALKREAERMEA